MPKLIRKVIIFLVILNKSVTVRTISCLCNRNRFLEAVQQHIYALIERCRNGDQKAQFEIYKKYYRAMYNTSLRIVGNSYEAEDIMQDSFLAAFTKLDSYSGKVTFGAWLKRIVINNSISALKNKKKLDTVPLEKVDYKDLNEDVAVLDTIDIKGLLGKVSQLKNNYKVALTLNLIEGYDYEEIAQIMEISYENSRTTVSRAKNKLRQLLTA